jgi:hypothetical protein
MPKPYNMFAEARKIAEENPEAGKFIVRMHQHDTIGAKYAAMIIVLGLVAHVLGYW